ncbi:hypothetical protein [Novosphingobium sp. Gsoil 351]|uniref:hypothetical protein n=1 Tax=Novosphingobium sp. Gsoil 351 TaxID=2675225 RepID=UPI0018A82D33|nr:hypothetical protein [Novosphingobium sp. Gsoil 351]
MAVLLRLGAREDHHPPAAARTAAPLSVAKATPRGSAPLAKVSATGPSVGQTSRGAPIGAGLRAGGRYA